MPNEGNAAADAPFKELLKQLARRNLRRGYQLSLPTGQAVARALGVEPLSHDELSQGNSAEMNRHWSRAASSSARRSGSMF